jgi:hypothetical protein
LQRTGTCLAAHSITNASTMSQTAATHCQL